MKKFLFLAIAAMSLCISCKNAPGQSGDGKFVINGTISDHSCDGAQIFLVPLTEEATHETVDSVVIKDGKFHFEGTKCRVASLRLQMPQRMKFQELLVYTESGTITAYVSENGSVRGTKNNDLLQQWKQALEGCNSARRSVLQSNHDMKDPRVMKSMDSIKSVVGDATYKFIKQTGLNPLSRFIYMGNRYTMTDSQRAELSDMETDYQHQMDSIRKAVAAQQQKEQK